MKEVVYMKNLIFNITERSEKGYKVRRNGEVPCVIYGGQLDKSISAKITRKEMNALLSVANNSVLSLNLDGKMERCVLKNIQRNTFGDIIHLDFQYVTKGETIKLKVPIVFTGIEELESRKLLLETNISEVQLQGEVGDFPENIEISVKGLEYGNQILGKDLITPETLKCDINEELVIASISASSSNDEISNEESNDEGVSVS